MNNVSLAPRRLRFARPQQKTPEKTCATDRMSFGGSARSNNIIRQENQKRVTSSEHVKIPTQAKVFSMCVKRQQEARHSVAPVRPQNHPVNEPGRKFRLQGLGLFQKQGSLYWGFRV